MAISIMSDNDLVLISKMSTEKLRAMIAPMNVREAMIFRRNLQISVASYSKKHRGHDDKMGGLDFVQAQIIGICAQIERQARNAFSITSWRKCKKEKKDMTYSEKFQEKERIKREWDKVLKTFSY